LLADCGYMSDEKFGAYHKLLYLIWRSPNCKVPNDDEWLAERLNRPVASIKTLYRQFVTVDAQDSAEIFCRVDGNWIYHKRLLREREFLRSKSQKQSARSKSRWNKEKDSSRGISRGNAPTPTISKEESKKEKKKESSSYTTAIQPDDDAGFEKSESGGEKLISAHAEWTKEAQKIRDYITKRLPNLKKQNASCVPKWLNLGLTYGEIIETIEETINLKNADIGSFAYLNRCIESVIQVKIDRDEQTKRMREKYAKPE